MDQPAALAHISGNHFAEWWSQPSQGEAELKVEASGADLGPEPPTQEPGLPGTRFSIARESFELTEISTNSIFNFFS